LIFLGLAIDRRISYTIEDRGKTTVGDGENAIGPVICRSADEDKDFYRRKAPDGLHSNLSIQ
jgi:hypothetical protein